MCLFLFHVLSGMQQTNTEIEGPPFAVGLRGVPEPLAADCKDAAEPSQGVGAVTCGGYFALTNWLLMYALSFYLLTRDDDTAGSVVLL